MKPLVVLLMGSPADTEHANKIVDALKQFTVDVAMHVGSAHRTPLHALEILQRYDTQDRAKVFITIAGRSNALSGFADPQVSAPVIACPPPGPEIDLWSSLRMPPGVAPAVVLEPVNAALYAAKILGLSDSAVAEQVRRFQSAQRDRVMQADQEMQK